MIRRKTTLCGTGIRPKYIEADIYYYVNAPHSRRGNRQGVTLPKQERLNYKNAIRYLNQLIKSNFTKSDYRLDLTYEEGNLPLMEEDANRIVSNYLKRLKRKRDKAKLPPLKYIWINEVGKSGRIHHHLIISGGLSRKEMEEAWSFRKRKGEEHPRSIGYSKCENLRFDDKGVEGLVLYITKETFKQVKKETEGQMTIDELLNAEREKGKKRWKQSQNLIKPRERVRDNAYSKRKIQKLVMLPPDCEEMRKFWEKEYKGYALDECTKEFNSVTGTWSIYLVMHRRN